MGIGFVAFEINLHDTFLLIVVVSRSIESNGKCTIARRQIESGRTQGTTVGRVAQFHHSNLGIEILATPTRLLEILGIYLFKRGGSTQISCTGRGTFAKIFRQQDIAPGRRLLAIDIKRIAGGTLNRRPVGGKASRGYPRCLIGHRRFNQGPSTHKIEGNHTIFLSDVGNRLTQQQPVIGSCRRCTLVGKRVVTLVGIKVTGLVVEAAVIIGRHDSHALASRLTIDDIVIPNRLVVIDLQNHQTRSGHILVPPHLLTILESKVLILVTRYNLVGFFTVGQIFERDGSRRGQFLDCNPAAEFTLISRITYGYRAVAVTVVVHIGTVVATIVHQTPGAHTIIGTAGIVEVGQAQRVAILMAERTDAITIGPGISLQLGRAGIGVDIFSIDRYRLPGSLIYIPGMGPNGIVERTGLIVGRLAITGINDIDQIDKAVVVAIVDGKIDR